jgi:peptidoglycan/xylan/chitin deacetylase (PgdA/CDA1 family)
MKTNIAEFWKLQPSRAKNKIRIVGSKDSSVIDTFENALLGVSFADKRVKPKWLSGNEKIKLLVPKICDVKMDGEVLLGFDLDGKDIPGIIYNGNEIVFTFDPDAAVENLINENYLAGQGRPFFTYSPIKYYNFPKFVRNNIFKFSMFLKSLTPDSGFPNWPVEKSVELIRHLYLNSLKLCGSVKTKKFWPQNKKFAICMTHDIDSKSGFEWGERFLEIEQSKKIKSAWNIVSHKYKIDFDFLRQVKDVGCEIGSHGDDHSGLLPYLDGREIERRLNASHAKLKEFRVTGFRSPQLQRNKKLMRKVAKVFSYDSSVPDTEIFSPFRKRSGCCTVFPFITQGIVELPLTMPMDYTMQMMGFDEGEMIDKWQTKIEWVESVGGLAMFNFHPDNYIFGNDDCLEIYNWLLRKLKRKNAWFALPSQAANWWKRR